MLGWTLIHSYSPWLGLAAGVTFGAALFGAGLWLLRLARVALPEPWHGVTAYLVGILSGSVAVEFAPLAMWWAIVPLGLWRFVMWARRQRFKPGYAVTALLFVHLIVAMAPVSRQDELDYHALVPERILHDGGLSFYTAPWEAAVWPQLGWDALQTPLFGLGVPQASGVLSWWTTAVLIWFVGTLLTPPMAALSCAALLAQGFSISQMTAMGPHAFGYLAGTVAVLAALTEPEGVGWVLPAAAAAMISGKLTMAPAATILCVAGLRRRSWRALASVALFLGPIAIWMCVHWRPFDAEALSVFRAMRVYSLADDNFLPLYEAANWGLLVWAACAAYFMWGKRRAAAVTVLAAQTLLMWFFIAKQIRFLGGLQYGLCAAGAMAAGNRYSKWLWAGIVPWACVVVWMSSVFWPVSLGFERPSAFLEKYTGLFQDYEALDRLLPRDAVILEGRSRSDMRQLAWLSKPPVFYAPRPVVFDRLDVPNGVPVFMLYVGAAEKFDPWLPEGYGVAERIYENARARFYPNRTPLGSADLESVAVYRLARQR